MRFTRFLMTASALAMGSLGLLGTFAADAAIGIIGAPATPALIVVGQIMGAMYLGFAGLNWMARQSLIGGIYNRPVVIGNLMHFLVAGLALLRPVAGDPELRALWPLVLLYSAFAIAFSVLLFRHPLSGETAKVTVVPGAATRS